MASYPAYDGGKMTVFYHGRVPKRTIDVLKKCVFFFERCIF